MSNKNNAKDMKRKIVLLVIDKLVLALILVAAGFMFNSILQRDKLKVDYQKQIFNTRVDAYLSVLKQAKRATDLLAVLYEDQGLINARIEGLKRRHQLNQIRRRANKLSSDGWSAGAGWVFYEEVIEPLEEINQIIQDKGLYFSGFIKQRVNDYLDTVIADINLSLQWRERSKEEEVQKQPSLREKKFNKEAWKRAQIKYQELSNAIKESLRIEGIILG